MVDFTPYLSPALDPLWKLLIALAIGLIIGFEREIAQEKLTNVKFAGLRTFGLAGLAGGLSAYLASSSLGVNGGASPGFAQNGYFIFGVVLLAIMALLSIAYFRSTGMHPHLGITTEFSVIVTFLMGGLTFFNPEVAIILTVIVAILLAFKQQLHEFTHKIPKTEFYDSLLFALIAVVILPILPDQSFGLPQYGLPDIINPNQIWLIVVFISGISYIGYFLVKWFGTTAGLALTGIVGGMASSTAVTTSMGANTRQADGLENEAMVAATLANTVMLIRVAFIVLVFFPSLLYYVYIPFGVMVVVGLLVASYFYLQSNRIAHQGQTLRLGSPFSIKPALTFGALITIILFVSKFAANYFGTYGLYITSLFAGLADVDAVTISASQLASNNTIGPVVAVVAILIAVFVNLGIRIVYAYYFGTKKFGSYTIFMALAMVVSGGIIAVLMLK